MSIELLHRVQQGAARAEAGVPAEAAVAGVDRTVAAQRVDLRAGAKARQRVRLVKMLCMLVLGVCFWYSVPYYLPLKVDPDPRKAAANEAAAYEGNLSRQIAMPIIAGVAVFMLWRLPRRGRLQSRFLWVAAAYCGWVAVSYCWSADPAVTGKRLVVFFIDVLFAFTLARVFSVRELAAFGFAQTSIVALLSLYVDLIQERIFAPWDADYRFTGVMTANYQAMNLVVSMMCAMTLLRKRPRWAKWLVPVIVAELVLLFLTRSRLGAIICIAMLGVLSVRFIKERMRAETRALVLLAGLAVALPALIYVAGSKGGGAAQDAFMMGRKDTENTSNLSNRAPLWAELWESVATRPLLGFGYAGFWIPARVEMVSADQGWMVPNAHNTYLDQTLSLGFVGAALYVGMLWGACALAWARNRREATAESLLPAVLLTWLALTSFAESVALDPYLPTMLAYSCIARMALREGSERESEQALEHEAIIGGGPLLEAATGAVAR